MKWLPIILVALYSTNYASPQIDRSRPYTKIAALAIDAIDGQIVVEAWVEPADSHEANARRPVSISKGLIWSIESGKAEISEDVFTGNTLFKPIGDEPVVARPELGSLIGESVIIGMNPDLLPVAERTFSVAGGGACDQSGLTIPSLDVRSVIDATVIPLSHSERVLRYRNGEYYAFDPRVGAIRIRYNPDEVSEIHLHSLHGDSENFFPAAVESRLFLVIELLSTGMKIYNRDPLSYQRYSR